MKFSRQEYWSGVPLPSPRQILYIYKSAKPPGKPKNTGVGTLSLLQRIFPTQESNRDLPHYRRILYQLSHQGSPLRRTHCNSVLCDVLSTLTNGTEWDCVYIRPPERPYLIYACFIPGARQRMAHCQCQTDSSRGNEVGAAKCECTRQVMWVERISVAGTETDIYIF